MSDKEKIQLISKMISDFWEYHEADTITAGTEVFVTAINSVVWFEPAKEDEDG